MWGTRRDRATSSLSAAATRCRTPGHDCWKSWRSTAASYRSTSHLFRTRGVTPRTCCQRGTSSSSRQRCSPRPRGQREQGLHEGGQGEEAGICYPYLQAVVLGRGDEQIAVLAMVEGTALESSVSARLLRKMGLPARAGDLTCVPVILGGTRAHTMWGRVQEVLHYDISLGADTLTAIDALMKPLADQQVDYIYFRGSDGVQYCDQVVFQSPHDVEAGAKGTGGALKRARSPSPEVTEEATAPAAAEEAPGPSAVEDSQGTAAALVPSAPPDQGPAAPEERLAKVARTSGPQLPAPLPAFGTLTPATQQTFRRLVGERLSDRDEVRNLLVCVSLVGAWIPHYPEVVQPLYAMAYAVGPFEWGPEAAAAYGAVRTALRPYWCLAAAAPDRPSEGPSAERCAGAAEMELYTVETHDGSNGGEDDGQRGPPPPPGGQQGLVDFGYEEGRNREARKPARPTRDEGGWHEGWGRASALPRRQPSVDEGHYSDGDGVSEEERGIGYGEQSDGDMSDPLEGLPPLWDLDERDDPGWWGGIASGSVAGSGRLVTYGTSWTS